MVIIWPVVNVPAQALTNAKRKIEAREKAPPRYMNDSAC